ncbi:MAG: hypothetical protein P8Q99_05195 [Paracoccaceae bacterium]|nr:hypothetical protein [Paracoccaceae bacterium]
MRPRHPAIVYAAKLARASLLQKSGETAWFRTGPGILTRAIARYIASAKPEVLENDLKLIPHHILLNDIAMTNPAAYKFSSKHWARQEKDEPIYQELLKQALTT